MGTPWVPVGTHSGRSSDVSEADLEEKNSEQRDCRWGRLGYESEDHFWRVQIESQRAWDATLGKRRPPRPRLPGSAPPERPGSRDSRTRQVNVKLSADDHDALVEAARSYGLRPSTMAQLLVNRGLKAVAEEEEEG